MTTNRLGIVVPAAGVGSRMNSSIPKQYLSINKKAILEHTLDKLSQFSKQFPIVVVVSENDPYFNELNLSQSVTRVAGGKERADSVLNGIEYLLENDICDWVLVHDAARPLVTESDIQNLIDTCFTNNLGGILASKVKDTIKQGHSTIETTVPRESLWHALTPQLFPIEMLHRALKNALKKQLTITDEASAVELQGESVLLVEGRSDNIKITTPEDLRLAQALLTPIQE